MNKQGNTYTIIYTSVMVIAVAFYFGLCSDRTKTCTGTKHRY